MTQETARAVLAMFAHTYTESDGRWVNKVGGEAPDFTIRMVERARAVVA